MRSRTFSRTAGSYLPLIETEVLRGTDMTKIIGATIGALVFIGLNIAISSAVSAQQITDCVTC